MNIYFGLKCLNYQRRLGSDLVIRRVREDVFEASFAQGTTGETACSVADICRSQGTEDCWAMGKDVLDAEGWTGTTPFSVRRLVPPSPEARRRFSLD